MAGGLGLFQGVPGPLRPAEARSGRFRAVKRLPTGAGGGFQAPNFACGMAFRRATFDPAPASLCAAAAEIQNSVPQVAHLLGLLGFTLLA